MKKIELKRVRVFIVVNILLLVPIALIYSKNLNDTLLILLMFCPTFAVILTRMITKEGFHDLHLKIKIKSKWKWYFFSWMGIIIISFVGAIVYFLLFPQSFSPLESKFAISSE